MKILLPYDAHPYTTANYCRDALRRLGHEVTCVGDGQEVEFLEHLQKDIEDYDFVFYVEGTTSYYLWETEKPRVWWAIDSHLHAGIRTEAEQRLYGEVPVDSSHEHIAKTYFNRPQDIIFTAQKATIDGEPYASAYMHGAKVKHLPLAAAPQHRPLDIEPTFDVVFVGNCNALHLRRRKLLDMLKAEYGERMLECTAIGEDMVKALHLGKVVFNCSVVGDVNMRYYETLAAGRKLVTDVNAKGTRMDAAVWVYKNDEDVISKIHTALQYDGLYLTGLSFLYSNSYDIRMQEVVSVVKKKVKKTTTPIAPSDPNTLTLKFPDEDSKKAMLAHIANHPLFAGAQQKDGKVVGAEASREIIEKSLVEASLRPVPEVAPKYESLQDQYERLCKTPSDINEHLPTLWKLAYNCRSVVEMGLRTGVSTTALLAGLRAGKQERGHQGGWMVSLDIDNSAIENAKRFSAYNDGVYYQAVLANSLEVNLGEFVKRDERNVALAGVDWIDMLFVDTLHTGQQLVQELFRHADQVKCYIVLHDTESFGYKGEDGEPGLWTAIGRFLANKKEWLVMEHHQKNNGLTILERV